MDDIDLGLLLPISTRASFVVFEIKIDKICCGRYRQQQNPNVTKAHQKNKTRGLADRRSRGRRPLPPGFVFLVGSGVASSEESARGAKHPNLLPVVLKVLEI